MTNLHSPTAILKEGVIYLEAFTEPKLEYYPRANEHSKIQVPFKDQEEIKRLAIGAFKDSISFGIHLDSILHRIEIVKHNKIGFEVNKNEWYAIIKPEQEEDDQIVKRGINTFKDVQMAAKVELILKPEHMNSIFTWKQIQDAILNNTSK